MLLVQQISKNEVLLVVYFIIVIAVLAFLFLLFFFTFQKRKNNLLVEKAVAQKEFENTLAQAENEIQEATLRNISMELHDNVGQLLSAAQMQLRMITPAVSEDNKEALDDTLATVSQGLLEVRQLSKSINGTVLKRSSLPEMITEELERYQKNALFTTQYSIAGEEISIDDKEKIIIFRMIQESCSNVMKYAFTEAHPENFLSIALDYKNEHLLITIKDNGKGYEKENVSKGSGLVNMQTRAGLLKAELSIVSVPGQGTEILINYPLHESSS